MFRSVGPIGQTTRSTELVGAGRRVEKHRRSTESTGEGPVVPAVRPCLPEGFSLAYQEIVDEQEGPMEIGFETVLGSIVYAGIVPFFSYGSGRSIHGPS